jgi:hypothetical protein
MVAVRTLRRNLLLFILLPICAIAQTAIERSARESIDAGN